MVTTGPPLVSCVAERLRERNVSATVHDPVDMGVTKT
jgi:hypothetical protein